MKAANRGRIKIENIFLWGLFSLTLGFLLGWIGAELPTNLDIEHLLVSIGIYVFLGSIIGYFSPNALCSGINLFAIFFGKLAGIYFNKMALIGILNLSPYMYIAIATAIMLIVGILLWNSRRDKWLGAFCGSIPIALLITEAVGYYQIWTLGMIIDLVMAIILYFIFYNQIKRLMALPIITILAVAMIYFGLYAKVFGGIS